jgi:hypothetical protein
METSLFFQYEFPLLYSYFCAIRTLVLTFSKKLDTFKSLPLQLIKAAVRAESYNISSFFIVIHELQRCLLTIAR